VKNAKIAYKNQELFKKQVTLEVDRDYFKCFGESNENRCRYLKFRRM